MACPNTVNRAAVGQGYYRGNSRQTSTQTQATGRIRCAANTNAIEAARVVAESRATRPAQRCCQCCCPCGQAAQTSGNSGFYGGTVRQEVYTTCCDACGGCVEYNVASRNTFWPHFARPRWLSCDELYGRQNRR